MVHILLAGCDGRMGREVVELCAHSQDFVVTAGISPGGRSNLFPVFSDWTACHAYADVVIDFSSVDGLDLLLAYCLRHETPALLAVTGYSRRQIEQIHQASRAIPIFQAANLSIAANTMQKLVKQASDSLGSAYDIVITEHHHKGKADSPSGTALLLSEAVGNRGEIHSLRSGTVPGEHHMIFSGNNEILELTHRTFGRRVYAQGAIQAAKFLMTVQKPGLYGMDDLLQS